MGRTTYPAWVAYVATILEGHEISRTDAQIDSAVGGAHGQEVDALGYGFIMDDLIDAPRHAETVYDLTYGEGGVLDRLEIDVEADEGATVLYDRLAGVDS